MSEIAIIRLAPLRMMMRFLRNRGHTFMDETRPRYGGLQIEGSADGKVTLIASDSIRLGVLSDDKARIAEGSSFFLPYSKKLMAVLAGARQLDNDSFAVINFNKRTLKPYYTKHKITRRAGARHISWGQAAAKFGRAVAEPSPAFSFDSQLYRNALELAPLGWRDLISPVLLPGDAPLPELDPHYVRSFAFISPSQKSNRKWEMRVGAIPRHDFNVVSMRTPDVPEFFGIIAPRGKRAPRPL